MSNILETIADHNRSLVRQAKESLSYEDIREKALSLPAKNFAFEKALRRDGMSYICECKKASPSKGLISPDFPYLSIARDYEKAGADAISVLTEPEWFMGSPRYLKEIAAAVHIPCLRKDFVVDSYMIYEAHLLGAQAVLLIVSLLTDKELEDYLSVCRRLGLSALVETHDRCEVERALAAGASIIGVNNRDLRDFTVDAANCLRLRPFIPKDVVFVAESGIHEHADIEKLLDAGVNAVLIGEAMMRSENKAAFLAALRGEK